MSLGAATIPYTAQALSIRQNDPTEPEVPTDSAMTDERAKNLFSVIKEFPENHPFYQQAQAQLGAGLGLTFPTTQGAPASPSLALPPTSPTTAQPKKALTLPTPTQTKLSTPPKTKNKFSLLPYIEQRGLAEQSLQARGFKPTAQSIDVEIARLKAQ
jgi:hypothetical protein